MKTRLGVLAVVVVLGLTACGGSDVPSGVSGGSVSTEGTLDWLDGRTYSSPYTFVLVDGAPEGVVAVNTATTVSASWQVDGEVVEVVDRERPGLVSPQGWIQGNELWVVGRLCPEPQLDDDSFVEGPSGCGLDKQPVAVRVLDLEAHRWSEPDSGLDLPASVYVPGVSRPGSGGLLFASRTELDGFRYVYSSMSRDGQFRSEVAVSDGRAVSGWPCPIDDGFLVVASPATKIEDVENEVATETVFSVVDETGLRDLPAVPRWVDVVGCAPGGVLAIDDDGVLELVTVVDGGPVFEAVDLPGASGSVRTASVDTMDVTVVWAEQRIAETTSTYQAWSITPDGWQTAGPTVEAGLDPPKVAGVVDGTLILGRDDRTLQVVG